MNAVQIVNLNIMQFFFVESKLNYNEIRQLAEIKFCIADAYFRGLNFIPSRHNFGIMDSRIHPAYA